MQSIRDRLSGSGARKALRLDRQGRKEAKFYSIVTLAWNYTSIPFSFVSGLYYYCYNTSPSGRAVAVDAFLLLATLALFGLWAAARLQLGSSLAFGATARGPLLTTGVYGLVRNPVYVFGTAALVTFSVLTSKGLFYVAGVLILMVPMQVVRAMRENIALKKAFGDEYVAYTRKVWF
jgi:protein-S-isoprenylcysteine O-methyltransferase Ste14